MTLGEMLAELRESRLDDGVEPYLWSDAELVAFLNDGIQQVCRRARCLTDSATAAICTAAVSTGQRIVPLDQHVLAIRAVRIDGHPDPLVGITARRLWKRCPGWDTADPQPCPTWWVPDYQEGCIALSPPPDAPVTLRMTVWRIAQDSELLNLTDMTSTPPVHAVCHDALLDWAEWRAYNKADADTHAQDRAANALAMFERKIGRLPSMTETRLWGVSRIVGVPAEFI